MFTIETIRNAQVEMLDGIGEGHGVYGETIAQVYNDSIDSYIDILRHPINPRVFVGKDAHEVTTFNVKIGSIIYRAFDFASEYLAVERIGGELQFFSIDSNFLSENIFANE